MTKKPKELFAIAAGLRAKTTNGDVVTVCDALMVRLTAEMADRAEPAPVVSASPAKRRHRVLRGR
jgi:hypothetical protein